MRTIRAAILASGAAALVAGCTDEDIGHVTRPTDWSIGAAAFAGPPVDCIEQARVRATTIRDERTIDFVMDDGRLLRNRLPFACAGLTWSSRFTYRTALPRLCSTDTITLTNAEGRAAANCGLGAFQPVAVPANPRPQPTAQ
jgi:hypothetical protein